MTTETRPPEAPRPPGTVRRVASSRWLPWTLAGVFLVGLIGVAGGSGAAPTSELAEAADSKVADLEQANGTLQAALDEATEERDAAVQTADDRVAVCQSDIRVISAAAGEAADAASVTIGVIIDVLTYGGTADDVATIEAQTTRIQAATESVKFDIQGCV